MPREKAKVDNNGGNKVSTTKMRETRLATLSESSQISASQQKNQATKTFTTAPDLVCLSHLRWNFVFQRPQHLLSRCAQGR